MKDNLNTLEYMNKGRLSGAGTHFAVTDSDYLNVTLDSTEEVKVTLESVPRMIILHIENTNEKVTSTWISIAGLEKNTFYNIYEDHLYNHCEFTANENGSYLFSQDISKPHLIFIQANASTYYLMEGGFSKTYPAFQDAGIGAWDPAARIATLTKDIDQTIEVRINDVTLTGLKPDKKKPVISVAGGNGIFINSSPDMPVRYGVSISNIYIKNCTRAIYAKNTTNITIQYTYIHNNYDGIFFEQNNNSNTVQYNSIYNNKYKGIFLGKNNKSNIIRGNSIYCNTEGINLSKENSLNVMKNNSVHDNISSGIYLTKNNNSNTILSNTFYNNSTGVFLYFQNNSNTIQYNRIYSNDLAGINVGLSNISNNILFNDINNNINTGALITGYNNRFEGNNFINNKLNAANTGNNIFLSNHWSDWDMSSFYTNDGVVDSSPSIIPIICNSLCFKQFSIEEYLAIPEQKPCAEEILDCRIDVEIKDINVFETPKGVSREFQILTGFGAVIAGYLLQKFEYIADEPAHKVHAIHFKKPFCTYLILPESYIMGTKIHINTVIEDVFYKLLDKRCILKNVALYLEAKIL